MTFGGIVDRIKELLAALANPESINADDLVAVRLELAAAFDEWRQTPEAKTAEGFEFALAATVVAEAADKVINANEDEMAKRIAALEDMAALVSPQVEAALEEAATEGGGDEPDPEAVPVADDGGADAAADEPAPELVSAAPERARVPLALISQRQPASAKPLPAEPKGPIIRAASNLNQFSAGQELTSDQAAEAMCEKLESASMASENDPPSILRAGRVDWSMQYPDERKLIAMNPEIADARIAKVVGEYPGDPRILEPAGLTASGGLCAPVTIRYELETVSTAERPLRAGLTSFNADRGGIQYMTPAHLVDILADQGSAALTTVTVANDAANATKTVQEAACGTLTTVQVRAIAERLQFSNFTDRYNPERMKQYIALARSAHSRLAERLLFEDMRASCMLVYGGAVWVGALRQWFNNILVAAEGMRYRNRMDEAYPLRCVLPEWFKELVAIDLGLQSNGERTVLGDFDAEQVINRWLAVQNIRPIWQRDGARTNDALGAGAPAFTAQTGFGAALNDFPGRMSTLLFPEGSFLFLDGGTLDFGIVRDSTLNASNRFQTFYEVFEGVAFVGVEALNIVTSICASGQGIAGTTTPKCGGVGS